MSKLQRTLFYELDALKLLFGFPRRKDQSFQMQNRNFQAKIKPFDQVIWFLEFKQDSDVTYFVLYIMLIAKKNFTMMNQKMK